MYVGKYCKWGKIQHCEKIAEGIYSVSTAGHGGIKLERKQNRMIPSYMRSEGGWYEEDCEWAIPAVVYKDIFGELAYDQAVKTLKNYYPDEAKEFLNVEVKLDESYVLRRRKFDYETMDKFVVFSAVSSDNHDGYCECWARCHGEEKKFLVPTEEYQKRDSFGFVIDDPKLYQELDV